jgi:geranylgeranyl diphosphate synthase, type I
MTAEVTLAMKGMRIAVQETLDNFLAEQRAVLGGISPDLIPFVEVLADLGAGGKRLRAAFCMWGYRAAGGTDLGPALRAAASLEMLQLCALIHDDVMDDSETRRGKECAHRRFARTHREAGWLGSHQRFGEGAAVLLGDLCLSWADELLYRSGCDASALAEAKPVFDTMRTELMAGQYLDLLEQSRGESSAERSMLVADFKSARYTVERPLHLGAALGGGSKALAKQLSAYGRPLGEAFQLRDDLLGVFGDPATTGKPAGDDLREGKRTLLVATALERASSEQAGVLRSGLGHTDLSTEDLGALRTVFVETGARAEVERAISERTARALAALTEIPVAEDVAEALRMMVLAATERTH